jgi:hypothetical protein
MDCLIIKKEKKNKMDSNKDYNLEQVPTKIKKEAFRGLFNNADGRFSSCITTSILFTLVYCIIILYFMVGSEPQPEFAYTLAKQIPKIILTFGFYQKVENVTGAVLSFLGNGRASVEYKDFKVTVDGE